MKWSMPVRSSSRLSARPVCSIPKSTSDPQPVRLTTYAEIVKTTGEGYRVLVTTLTKKMAESLTTYLGEMNVKVRLSPPDVQTMERQEIIRDLRLGVFDVLVGINLLREGLDLPEVALVAILDADKEGFLRSEVSMIQTIGRAARNANGRVIMYADVMTESMNKAIFETQRRRQLQQAYNQAHGIVPQTVMKSVRDVLQIGHAADEGGCKRAVKRQGAERGRAATAHLLDRERCCKPPPIWTLSLQRNCATSSLNCWAEASKRPEETVTLPQRKRAEGREKARTRFKGIRRSVMQENIVIRGVRQNNLRI